MKHLGEDLDIHCGGIDNAFPHHTNEIAQSESCLGHKWCNWWMHVLHLNTNSGKMSKSKGEFLTVSLLEEKGYDPLAYRFFCLQSHYRKSLVFSWENLDNAQGTYNKLIARVAALKPGDGAIDQAVFDVQKEKFRAALGSDLNTSLGVTAVYDVLKAPANDGTKLALLADFDRVLGLRDGQGGGEPHSGPIGGGRYSDHTPRWGRRGEHTHPAPSATRRGGALPGDGRFHRSRR